MVCRRCENFDPTNRLGSEGKLYKTRELSMFIFYCVTDPLWLFFQYVSERRRLLPIYIYVHIFIYKYKANVNIMLYAYQ